ncbi:MAG: hypothetical protein JOY64_35645 [Alphaproteobacteria bacterium]|nr:hypothetical protein [Alphaproteobacteria bacterium]
MVQRTYLLRSVRLAALSPLLLAAAACGASPTAPQQADQEAKQFAQPAPDKGALYVYRSPGFFGAAQALDIGIAGGASAALAPNTYIRIEGPPGPVEVDCKVRDKSGSAQVQVGDGQTRFVEVWMTMGWWTPGCEVAEVSPDQGRVAVLSGRRLEPQ